jgi:acetyltransferase-like isoleucine patch superfamily enzyme
MKNQLKSIITFFNTIWIRFILGSKNIKGTKFYYSRIKLETEGNDVNVIDSTFEKVFVRVHGQGNVIETNKVLIGEAFISIWGNNNKVILNDGVVLRSAEINVRGNNCEVTVGKNTTFEGIRMVTVGHTNKITIGEDCLFSDKIEIWASDTHSILNDKGEFINPEKSIYIGNHVWVGCRSIILKGVTINDGSIIGMASVVTKDVPAGVVSVGSPSKTIKENVSWSKNYHTQPELIFDH